MIAPNDNGESGGGPLMKRRRSPIPMRDSKDRIWSILRTYMCRDHFESTWPAYRRALRAKKIVVIEHTILPNGLRKLRVYSLDHL